MKLKYVICAESTSFDQFTGRVSLFHVIDQVSAPTFPIAFAGFAVVACFERTREEPEGANPRMTITIGETQLASYELDVQFGNNLMARSVGNLQGFFVPHPGRLQVAIQFKEERMGEWDIDCSQVGQLFFENASAGQTTPQAHSGTG